MANEGMSATVLRNLAKDLLTADENEAFRSALQTYKASRSLTNLVTQLTSAVTSTEKLMLLVELGRILPEHIRADFHKLCCLHFPKYNSFLTYFNPNTISERNRVISKDSSGHFQVISNGPDQSLFANVNPTDQRSLQGESGIDVNSDIDDISRHGCDVNGGSLESSWKIENRSHGGSVSSQQNADRVTSPSTTPKGSVSSANQISWKQSHSSLPQEQSGGIRNRARSLRILSGSLPSVLAAVDKSSASIKGEEKARILLKRRTDGSLGVGVRGGKEYNTPIEVCQVEPGSQGHMQGLRVGDRILDVNGTDFTNVTHTEAVMMMRNAWNIIMIVQHSPQEDITPDGGLSYRSNMSFDDLDVFVYPTKKGKLGCGVYRDAANHLVITNVEKNSPASKAGIHKGDHLFEIDGLKVSSLTDKQVSTMTNVKRVRMKVYRPSMSIKTQDTSDHVDFNDMFSNFALNSSRAQQMDRDGMESDCATFASSTPRNMVRSRSEERRPNSNDLELVARQRSASQARASNPTGSTNEKRASKLGHRPAPSPSPSRTSSNTTATLHSHQNHVTQPQQKVALTNGRSSVREMVRKSASPSEIDSIDDNYIMSSGQQRMYKPKLMTGSKYSTSNSYSPSLHHKSHLTKPSKPLGRYISRSDQHALPSRMAMMYTPKTMSKPEVVIIEQDRSRARKREPSSASSKMRELRNRSHSPHSSAASQGDKRSGSVPTRGDREFLRAIQNSVERRQRAQRLSLYQLPDHDDDTWNIG